MSSTPELEPIGHSYSAAKYGSTITVPPSPAPTALSFRPGDDKDATDLVKVIENPEPQRPANAVEFITRDIDRDTPASPGFQNKPSKEDISRKRSTKGANYYVEVFAVREQGPAIPKTAGVCVELKTNVILEDEFHFAKLLSEMIAKRYNRSEENVCVTLEHSACMVMGGTFDGTYVLTITSVAMISPTVNKRNAAVIADWFKNNLGVSGNRGYIRFVDPEFSNYATGGYTMLDLMEKEEIVRTGTTERTGIIREKSMKRSMSRYQSKKDRKSEKTLAALTEIKKDTSKSDNERPATPSHRLRKKSIFNLFTKSARTAV